MASSLQQIKQATKRKSNGFFFIKSKHVHPTFKNHTYFEMKPKCYTEQSQSQLTQENALTQQFHANKWKMFVDEPSSYGIENTFRYMCSRIRLANRRDIPLRMSQGNEETDREPTSPPNLETIVADHAKQGDLRAASVQPTKPNRKRIHSEPGGKYLETTESFNYRIRKSKKSQDGGRPRDNRPKEKQDGSQSAQHLIEMVYIPGRAASFVGNGAEVENKICLNLLPYVINCFFKCKINYKKISQFQYEEIKKYIEQVKSTVKCYFDVKDIINLSTVEEVLQILRVYGQGSLEWAQTVRYFFMPTQDILAYQFEKMLDEIKVMSIMKFNAELSHQPLFIYRVEDKLKINNVYDMLKPGTYIYSENKACYQIYCNMLRRRAEAFSYKNRVNKWRSVAPLDESQTLCPPDSKASEDSEKQALEKYQRLFEIRKERRKKYSTKKQIVNSGIMITAQLNSSFIDKSKLHRSEDIFE